MNNLYLNEQVEVDFINVDSGERSGDAIVFRYGDFRDRDTFKVVVIDGGTVSSGDKLVEHIKNVYNTSVVDLVICTHPDSDHASGLRQVLNNLEVRELWLHKPWDHSAHICDLFHDGRITDDSLDRRLREAYDYAHQLEQIANEINIPTKEPFADRTFDNGIIQVLGPDIDYYRTLLPDFARSPEAAKNLLEKAFSAFSKAITWVKETFGNELLDESGVTSAENSSSACVLLTFGGKKYLFTGDAGIASLHRVIDYAESKGINLKALRFMQVPHHGSKRNLSPSVLDRLHTEIAFVSAAKDSEKHPSKKVLNAFTRRNMPGLLYRRPEHPA